MEPTTCAYCGVALPQDRYRMRRRFCSTDCKFDFWIEKQACEMLEEAQMVRRVRRLESNRELQEVE
mgnify:CR=1 FL=1